MHIPSVTLLCIVFNCSLKGRPHRSSFILKFFIQNLKNAYEMKCRNTVEKYAIFQPIQK